MGNPDILQGYAVEAAELIPRYEALSSAVVLAPVKDVLPDRPSSVLDVGAVTGRDAAWLAGHGHKVVAVEPVDELRQAGMALHPSQNIQWIDDRLPALQRLRSGGKQFELVLAIGVWQHLPAQEHQETLRTLAALTREKGRLVISLRHGPGSPSRPCFSADTEQIIACAADVGFRLHLRRAAPSVQEKNRDAGVTWTWLCLERL